MSLLRLYRGFARLRDKLIPPAWHRAIKSEQGVPVLPISIATALRYVVWSEPNRADTPALHIGRSGDRYPTITGLWWLDNRRMVVAHRNGLRIGVFDIDRFDAPVWTAEVPHQADDIAAKSVGNGAWEVALSGCWGCIYSRYRLENTPGQPQDWTLTPTDTQKSATRDFCHGVAYDAAGQFCWSIHAGKKPRFAIGDAVYQLPYPWGVRDSCGDPARNRHLAIAVSADPRRRAYDGVVTSIWQRGAGAKDWTCLAALPGVHSDSLEVWDGHIWCPDQLGNRILALNADTGEVAAIYAGDCLDFPHGLGVSPDGLLAVTNYGASSVVVLDTKVLLG